MKAPAGVNTLLFPRLVGNSAPISPDLCGSIRYNALISPTCALPKKISLLFPPGSHILKYSRSHKSRARSNGAFRSYFPRHSDSPLQYRSYFPRLSLVFKKAFRFYFPRGSVSRNPGKS